MNWLHDQAYKVAFICHRATPKPVLEGRNLKHLTKELIVLELRVKNLEILNRHYVNEH